MAEKIYIKKAEDKYLKKVVYEVDFPADEEGNPSAVLCYEKVSGYDTVNDMINAGVLVSYEEAKEAFYSGNMLLKVGPGRGAITGDDDNVVITNPPYAEDDGTVFKVMVQTIGWEYMACQSAPKVTK